MLRQRLDSTQSQLRDDGDRVLARVLGNNPLAAIPGRDADLWRLPVDLRILVGAGVPEPHERVQPPRRVGTASGPLLQVRRVIERTPPVGAGAGLAGTGGEGEPP